MEGTGGHGGEIGGILMMGYNFVYGVEDWGWNALVVLLINL
jgi:hypothetical protein